MKTTIFASTLAIILALTACSKADSPSKEGARAALEQRIEGTCKGFVRLGSFQKTNGIPQQFGPLVGYGMEVAGDLEILQDCVFRFCTSCIGDDMNNLGRFEARHANEPDHNDFADGMVPVKAGQHITFRGTLYFQKTENGWRMGNVTLR